MEQNTKRTLWFRRKRYGWGWIPCAWQGWAIIAAYVAVVLAFGLTIDHASPTREVAFTFILPVAILTALMIRLAYKFGEKPRWQWGEDKGDIKEE